MNKKPFFNFLKFIISFSLISSLLLYSCSEPCDGESFFSWLSINFIILDRDTEQNFFTNNNSGYLYSNFKVVDELGNECSKDDILIFPNYGDTNDAMSQELIKYYFFHFNDADTDTLKVIVKGTYSDPCDYEIAEYIKVYYNKTVVYYNLYPVSGYETDLIKIYK